mmetsp:Transcript_3157/g.12090  ORF Transcript_3157/g.12090 Transcript_3157/m.12090 type:complete len:80 (+) Transcript_3157:1737-1976(+)
MQNSHHSTKKRASLVFHPIVTKTCDIVLLLSFVKIGELALKCETPISSSNKCLVANVPREKAQMLRIAKESQHELMQRI